ncbi:N-acetyltransferase family protein [Uruburuella testudinis]|uniref:N-acetyltransferase family protein n=1 Tax=Uruburuella testudinis TaxID=1282863 RepID=A0ABY4DWK3_9NEIS|nr:GNAT family N-acetyltransferase [Uruburuella testudinis]UOO81066.1 N-acetyltransferase family protein [Uruburuella testudinis]
MTEPDYTFTRADAADLPAIVAIYNSTIPSRRVTGEREPVSVESRRAWFESHQRPHRPIIAAKNNNGEVAAWASFNDFYAPHDYDIFAEISIYVHENHRGSGLGAQLLQHMESIAPELGIRSIMAMIFAHNPPSITLFERAGYTLWGRLPKVADMDGLLADIVIYGKAL